MVRPCGVLAYPTEMMMWSRRRARASASSTTVKGSAAPGAKNSSRAGAPADARVMAERRASACSRLRAMTPNDSSGRVSARSMTMSTTRETSASTVSTAVCRGRHPLAVHELQSQVALSRWGGNGLHDAS